MERRYVAYRTSKSVHWCNLCACPWDQKRQIKKLYSGKLAICPEYPRGPIERLFGMVGGFPAEVTSFKIHQHWQSSYW